MKVAIVRDEGILVVTYSFQKWMDMDGPFCHKLLGVDPDW